jgi:hypothetical protein
VGRKLLPVVLLVVVALGSVALPAVGRSRAIVVGRAVAPSTSGVCAPLWRSVAAPDPGVSNALLAVDVRAAHDAWAVGAQSPDGVTLSTLIDHYDGKQWRAVVSPNAVGQENVLQGVHAIAANDVWAVGRVGVPFATRVRALIEHYDGSTWGIAHTPAIPGDTYLSAVFGFAHNDVWAAGFTSTASTPRTALVLHWDGSRWSVANLPPDPGVNNYLFALTGSGPGDIWTVGANFHGSGDPTTIHWNGRAWTRVTVTTATASDTLTTAASVSRNDVWAAGTAGIYQNDVAIVAHWNGAGWSFPSFPQLGTGVGGGGASGPVNEIDGLAAVSGSDVWAVGQFAGFVQRRRSPLTGMFGHFDGHVWQAWPGLPKRLPAAVSMSGATGWSVGQQLRGAGFHSAIDRICPARGGG